MSVLTVAKVSDKPKLPLQWTPIDKHSGVFSGHGSNVFVSNVGDGVFMVDGGFAEHAESLLKNISEKLNDALPTILFNTHWHRAQTGCNAILGKAGATIIAHENTKLWLGTDVHSTWENRIDKALPPYALPNSTFYYDNQTVTFNGEVIEYGYLPQAHTDGDLYVFLPKRNILIAGGVVSAEAWPLVDFVSGGWLGGMIGALKALIKLTDEETVIIPASGKLCSQSDLKEQLNLCECLIEKVARNYYSGLTYQDFLDGEHLSEFDHFSGNPDQFLHTAYEGAWRHVRELRQFARRR